MPVELPTVQIGAGVRYKVWRSQQGQAFAPPLCGRCGSLRSLPAAVRGMGPWTGGPEGAIDRLRLPFRVMINQQGFTVVYAHVAQLELEMTPGALHGVPPANAESPQCHGDGLPQLSLLRQKTPQVQRLR